MASLSDEDAVESVVRGLHVYKTVRFPTVCKGLQLTSWVVWKVVLLLVPSL